MMRRSPNHLIHETSPYLQQHAYNPVNWYPWGDEAFKHASDDNKPVFLSIGYAACHWCHVMEKESFENDSIAGYLNKHFICIKVDREERPDIDQVYMHFVQITTGSGGWPMSVFLTPGGKPFFGGTYYPPEDKFGRPGFKRIIRAISEFYGNQCDKLQDHIAEIDQAYLNSLKEAEPGELPTDEDFKAALSTLADYYEPQYGGIGQAPKFPAVQCFQLFLRYYKKSGESRYLNMTEHTLQKMGKGGIFDQLGGGFARYSVDNEWLVPHFEKMLYDNAQLCNLYLDAYKVTKNHFYLNISKEILGFVMREMLSPEGGFYSSLDADSEGEEGKYYTWDKGQVLDIVGKENGELVCNYFDVTQNCNFEGKNILRVKSEIRELSVKFSKTEEEINRILDNSKRKLFTVRQKRIRPSLDDKVIVSWNALMLSAFAVMYQVTQDEQYAEVVKKGLGFIKSKLYLHNQLMHIYKDGEAKINGFLDDYAYLSSALLDAYEALFDESFLAWAQELLDQVNVMFWDNNSGGYFYTSDDQRKLYKRLKDQTDQSIPSGTGIILMSLMRMYYYTGNKFYLTRAEEIFKKYGYQFSQNPYGYASFLNAYDLYIQSPKEITIVYRDQKSFKEILKYIQNTFLPGKIIIVLDGQGKSTILNPDHLEGRNLIGEKITVYVCRNFSCEKPVTTLEDLVKLMD